MKKIAIIGASVGQEKLCAKAQELGLYTVGFAWEHTEVKFQNMFSKFYPISITDMDKIVDVCRSENVDGVVSNASDLTASVVAYVTTKLGLCGNNYQDFIRAENKFFVRQKTNLIPELQNVKCKQVTSEQDLFIPCVIKPCVGHSKQGVYFVGCKEDAYTAFEYAKQYSDNIFIEDFITGKEFSIESISYKGRHMIVQVTEKISAGSPHFIELGHIQPASISDSIRKKLDIVIPKILDSINFTNGASHIEIKIDTKTEDIYLIEVNLRGGGGEISNTLVGLSTDFDYLKAMIDVAFGTFVFPKEIKHTNTVGIYHLCEQSQSYIKSILANKENIIINKLNFDKIQVSSTNYDRQGYVIYKTKG